MHCFETLSIYCYYYLLRLEEAKILFSNFTWKKHFFVPENGGGGGGLVPRLPPFPYGPDYTLEKQKEKKIDFMINLMTLQMTLATSSTKQFPYRYSK